MPVSFLIGSSSNSSGSSDIGDSSSRDSDSSSDESDEEVALELAVKHLGQEVQGGDEGGLEDDWDVGGVEQLHLISWWLSTLDSLVLHININLESLGTVRGY